jgi:predicted lipid-binding transport protein (Tim44 family)
MKTPIRFLIGVIAVLAVNATVTADVIIYPAKGQSSQQMEKDKYECYSWAKQSSGFDPMAQPRTTSAPPPREAKQGGAGRGLARGALGGVAIGALTGNTKKGAKIGAVSGGLIGGMRRNDQVKREKNAQNQWEQAEVANYSQNRNNYDRAYAACLSGRGYTVN